MNEREIFEQAIEILDPQARQEFLDTVCGNNSALRTRLDNLLKSHDCASLFLQRSVPEQLSPADHPAKTEQTLSAESSPTVELPPGSFATRFPTQEHEEDDSELDLSFLSPSTYPESMGKIGHYEVLQALGRGGFGTVFRAFDEKLHRDVALKVMHPQLAATSPPRKRFVREARSAAAINHDNVVRVFSVEEQPLPYLVMEYISGQTLQQKLDQNGPLDVTEVVMLGQQIARGLAAAHALNLIHRDIKPGNILIGGNGEPRAKITDFGLARAADDASLTQSGMIAGTPLYMAPEQAMGQTLDHRSDLFSLGSVMYQMACGRPPFRAATTIAVLRRVAEDAPREIQEIVPEIPDWLVAIIDQLLQKQPEDRFQSAHELADLLGRCLAQWQTTGRVTAIDSATYAAPASQSALLDQPKLASPSAGRKRRQPFVLVATALLGTGILLPILFTKQMSSWISSWRKPDAFSMNPASVNGRADPTSTDNYSPVPPSKRNFELLFDGSTETRVEIPSLHLERKAIATLEGYFTPRGECYNRQAYATILGGRSHAFTVPPEAGNGMWRLAWTQPSTTAQGYVHVGCDGPQCIEEPKVHIAGVRDTDEIRFYFDGKLLNKTLIERFPIENNEPVFDFMIGAGFVGHIDEVRVSRSARYQQDFAPQHSLEVDDDTLALYHFDEGDGDVLHDSSGHGHDGIVVNATWIECPAGSSNAALLTSQFPPLDPEWRGRVTKLRSDEQVAEVTKELKRRNPTWEERMEPTFRLGLVDRLTVDNAHLRDITPLSVFGNLTWLTFTPSNQESDITDLTPLSGMKLLHQLDIPYSRKLRNLTPLKNLPLNGLNIIHSRVWDLTPLSGKSLHYVHLCGCTLLRDVSPLKDAPLTRLIIHHSGITDLTPLKNARVKYFLSQVNQFDPEVVCNWPLEEIAFELEPTGGAVPREVLERLKGMATLKLINEKPVEEFWKEYDKQEAPVSRSE